MDNKNLYTNTAKFYDKGNEINKYDFDIEFYEAYMNESTIVLEIACGTGRVTVPVASKCKRIIGMDLSQSMLKELNNKISRLDDNYKNNIKTSQADMTEFNMDEKFDLIIFPGMAFLSLTNNEQRIKCLECVKKHINENGKIIIDLFNPNPDKLDCTNVERIDFEYFDSEIGHTVRKTSIQQKHDRENQIIWMKYILKILNGHELVNQIEDEFKLGYLFDEQARNLFKSVGLNLCNVYGGYDFSKVAEENKRMMIYELQLLN